MTFSTIRMTDLKHYHSSDGQLLLERAYQRQKNASNCENLKFNNKIKNQLENPNISDEQVTATESTVHQSTRRRKNKGATWKKIGRLTATPEGRQQIRQSRESLYKEQLLRWLRIRRAASANSLQKKQLQGNRKVQKQWNDFFFEVDNYEARLGLAGKWLKNRRLETKGNS